jgi:hypothetical protein
VTRHTVPISKVMDEKIRAEIAPHQPTRFALHGQGKSGPMHAL